MLEQPKNLNPQDTRPNSAVQPLSKTSKALPKGGRIMNGVFFTEADLQNLREKAQSILQHKN